jgi:4-hydroxy-tetrahydrodipicolinate synthase
MTPAVIRRIVMANPSCIMLKHEDWPGLDKISTLRRHSCLDAQRKPGAILSKTARNEVNYLLRRFARHDERARVKSLLDV